MLKKPFFYQKTVDDIKISIKIQAGGRVMELQETGMSPQEAYPFPVYGTELFIFSL